jgi:hypothetical protein
MIISGMDTDEVLALLNDYNSIQNTLSRRGFDIKDIADSRDVIQATDLFYENLKSVSFRQILKLIYDAETGIGESEILRKLSSLTPESLSSKLKALSDDGCVIKDNSKYSKALGKDYARTFEWFICEAFKRELKGIASSGVKVLNLRCGGDFDVIARLEDLLVYIECKSGSIFNITKDEITNYLARYKELAPSFSILLIDTNGLPIQFNDTFEKADWNTHGLKSRLPKRRRISGRGIFYEVIPRIHVVTNEGNLISNIKLSVNHFFSFGKPYAVIAPGADYLSKFYDEYEVEKT